MTMTLTKIYLAPPTQSRGGILRKKFRMNYWQGGGVTKPLAPTLEKKATEEII